MEFGIMRFHSVAAQIENPMGMFGELLHDGVRHAYRFVFPADDDDGDLPKDQSSLRALFDHVRILLEVNGGRSGKAA